MKQGFRITMLQNNEEHYYDVIGNDVNFRFSKHREKIQDFEKIISIELTQTFAYNKLNEMNNTIINNVFNFLDSNSFQNVGVSIKVDFYRAESITHVINADTGLTIETEIEDEDLFTSEFYQYSFLPDFIDIQGFDYRIIPTTQFLTESLVIILKEG